MASGWGFELLNRKPSLTCGGSGIRTHGALRHNGFRDRPIRPLSHPSVHHLRVSGANRGYQHHRAWLFGHWLRKGLATLRTRPAGFDGRSVPLTDLRRLRSRQVGRGRARAYGGV
jgi:hypothetical protein